MFPFLDVVFVPSPTDIIKSYWFVLLVALLIIVAIIFIRHAINKR